MEIKRVSSFSVMVYMAGDYDDACSVLRDECWGKGMCVTIRRERFIYTGGEEDGIAVGFQHYPRFPSNPDTIVKRAMEVTEGLMACLCQRTALVVTPVETIWLRQTAPGERSDGAEKVS